MGRVKYTRAEKRKTRRWRPCRCARRRVPFPDAPPKVARDLPFARKTPNLRSVSDPLQFSFVFNGFNLNLCVNSVPLRAAIRSARTLNARERNPWHFYICEERVKLRGERNC